MIRLVPDALLARARHPGVRRRWPPCMAMSCVVAGLGLASPDLPLLGTDTASAKTFRGETSQERRVLLTTNAEGRIWRVRIGWRTVCRPGSYSTATQIIPPLDEDSINSFRDAGSYRENDRPYRATITVLTRGRRSFDPANPRAESWAGSFRVRVVVRRGGRVIARCPARTVRWEARLA